MTKVETTISTRRYVITLAVMAFGLLFLKLGIFWMGLDLRIGSAVIGLPFYSALYVVTSQKIIVPKAKRFALALRFTSVGASILLLILTFALFVAPLWGGASLADFKEVFSSANGFIWAILMAAARVVFLFFNRMGIGLGTKFVEVRNP